jgi:hypothetical protein
LSKLLKAMRLRCAVLKIPAESSVPPGLPLSKNRSLRTHSESTLPQLLIPLHFNSFRCNVYKKPGEGAPHPRPKVLQLITNRTRFLRTRTKPRNPIPLIALLHDSRIPRGWGISEWDSHSWLSFLASSRGSQVTNRQPRDTGHRTRAMPRWSPRTVAPQPAKCQNHASCSGHRREETYPLRTVSNELRADIGHGIYRAPSPIASRSQIAEPGSYSQEGLGPPF